MEIEMNGEENIIWTTTENDLFVHVIDWSHWMVVEKSMTCILDEGWLKRSKNDMYHRNEGWQKELGFTRVQQLYKIK